MKTQLVLKNPLARKAWAAMQEAVAQVVEQHRREGRPLAVWENGKAVWVTMDKPAVIREAPAAYRTRARSKPR